jgi:hypothetical protein
MTTRKMAIKPRRLLFENLLATDFAKGCPQFGHDAACVETFLPHAWHFIRGMLLFLYLLFAEVEDNCNTLAALVRYSNRDHG